MIEEYDSRALQIKGWSVTVSLAGMAAALVSKDVTADLKAMAFLVAAIASLAFWVIEFSWKRFQWSFYGRIREIEDAFVCGREAELPPLQISRAFSQSINKVKFADVFKPFYPFISLPHAPIAALGIYLACAFSAASAGQVSVFGHVLVLAQSNPDSIRQ